MSLSGYSLSNLPKFPRSKRMAFLASCLPCGSCVIGAGFHPGDAEFLSLLFSCSQG